MQHRKIGNSKSGNSVFSIKDVHCPLSFDIFVVTYRVTNFLPKLVDILLFSTEKTEFPVLVFPYFGFCRTSLTEISVLSVIQNPHVEFAKGTGSQVEVVLI